MKTSRTTILKESACTAIVCLCLSWHSLFISSRCALCKICEELQKEHKNIWAFHNLDRSLMWFLYSLLCFFFLFFLWNWPWGFIENFRVNSRITQNLMINLMIITFAGKQKKKKKNANRNSYMTFSAHRVFQKLGFALAIPLDRLLKLLVLENYWRGNVVSRWHFLLGILPKI